MKIKRIRSLIYGKYDSEAVFASKIGWTRQRLSKITNGIQEPTVTDIDAIAKGLECPIEEIAYIFLDLKSPNG